jgi:hypothetical protein
VNNNTQDQLNKYAIMLREERNEKKDLLDKYENLRVEYTHKIEEHADERVKISQRYYLLLGIVIVLLFVTIYFAVNSLLDVSLTPLP